MLFNSIDFAIFLPIIFAVYWILKNRELQNYAILISSYFFYGWWDWRFLSLIFFSTIIDYSVGLRLKNEGKKKNRKLLLWISITVNLGILGFFKYFNFFLDNFIEVFSIFGQKLQINSLNLILPIGISFYTFQTLSYSIDVYKKKIQPTNNFIAFAAFVSFFPQLVAGPIERAANLLPQFIQKRFFKYESAVDGLRQILWGFFKKVVIADSCAVFADNIFNNYRDLNGISLSLGAVFFAFQIYGDFSGYSDIAIGTARLFGFNLMRNFAFPYFSRDIAEFWRRWHISLSSWFRDYVYIPLGGSRCNIRLQIRNVLIIFIVSGLWHGAKWTFILWGLLNAFYFMPLLLKKMHRYNLGIVAEGKIFPSLRELFYMIITFSFVVLAWVFFRADNISTAFTYLWNIFSNSLFAFPNFSGKRRALMIIILVICFVIIEWIGREQQYAIARLGLKWKRPLRYAMYYLIIFSIFWFYRKDQQFIYFQF